MKLRRLILHPSSFILLIACSRTPVANTHDDLDRPVALPARITRVVTLAPNLTEIVYAIGAEDRIAGTDDFSDEPAAAKTLPKVGGMQPNIEKIVALRPDVVLATTTGNHPNLAPALAAVKIPLFVVRTDRLDEVPRAMERVASILGVRTNAAEELRAAIARQKRTRARRPRLLFVVWADPLYVAGRDTFSDDLLRLTGAENIVTITGWPQYSLESLVANPPDLILYVNKIAPSQIEKLRTYAHVPAVAVDENLFTRPGPRVSSAAETLNRILDSR